MAAAGVRPVVVPPVPRHLVQAQREIKAGRLTSDDYVRDRLAEMARIRSADDRKSHNPLGA